MKLLDAATREQTTLIDTLEGLVMIEAGSGDVHITTPLIRLEYVRK